MNVNNGIISFKKGEYIFKEGDPSEKIYQILEGSAEIVKNHNGDNVIIAIARKGDTIGELGIIQDRLRESSVIAREDIKLREIDPRIFDVLAKEEDYRDIILIVSSLAEHVREYGNKLLEYGITNARVKDKNIFYIVFKPISQNAISSFGDFEKLVIKKLPFTIGRYSRRKTDRIFHRNDFYLMNNYPYTISRNHFILLEKNGDIFFRDHGSKLGSIVNGIKVNKHHMSEKLKLGINEIILGSEKDDFVYELIVEKL